MDDFVHVTIITKTGDKTSTVTIPKARAVSSSVEFYEDAAFGPDTLMIPPPRRVKAISFDIDGPVADREGSYLYLEENNGVQ